jgi:hypothetical protein
VGFYPVPADGTCAASDGDPGTPVFVNAWFDCAVDRAAHAVLCLSIWELNVFRVNPEF